MMDDETYHRLREDTKHLIREVLTQTQVPMTRTQIAKAIGRAKTPNLISILDEMVHDEQLRVDVKTFHNGVQGYIYALKR